MTSQQQPNMLPVAHASFHAPPIVASDYTRTLDLAQLAPVPLVTVEAPQHSPPELYTLHASLLI
jgi:hypothetical protein